MTTSTSALSALESLANTKKAAEMAAYHKVDRIYLGVSNPQIDMLYKEWRKDTNIDQRVAIAAHLWDSNIHEARVAAAKLLTQARIHPDDAVWSEIVRWASNFDAWAIADHACSAGSRRLVANPKRLELVETWTANENMWIRRAALVITLPWTKQNYPSNEDLEIRDWVLGWAASYVSDQEWFIQKAVGWWLRSLSKHDAPRVHRFLKNHGNQMKAFARKEASKYL